MLVRSMRKAGVPLSAHYLQQQVGHEFVSLSMLSFGPGDDCQLLLWDLAGHTQSGTSPRTASSRLNSPRPDVKKRTISDPVMAYTAPGQISQIAWSPVIQGIAMHSGYSTATGEWVAISSGKSIKTLKV
jgi:DDB1- and CUL4-associated factor 7